MKVHLFKQTNWKTTDKKIFGISWMLLPKPIDSWKEIPYKLQLQYYLMHNLMLFVDDGRINFFQ